MTRTALLTLVYARPERLRKTLQMIDASIGPRHDVHIVNNGQPIDLIEAVVSEFAVDLPITLHHNKENRGSRERLVYGRWLALTGYDYILTFDDDVDFGRGALHSLYMQKRPDAIVGWKAYRFRGDYWVREDVHPGEPAHYVGTGFAIIPSAAYRPGIILDLPMERSAADDLWLSYVANACAGLLLTRGEINGVSINVDGKDQYTNHIDMKREFLRELQAKGWAR